MSAWELLDKLEELIEMLIDCHPQGFAVLLGDAPRPTARQIHDMLQARRSSPRPEVRPATPNLTTEAERIVWDAEAFDAVVEGAYGWDHIVETCRCYREAFPKLWAVVIDHHRFVENSVSRVGSSLGYVATRHKLAPDTVTRYRREFPSCLARSILCPPSDSDDFRLMPG